MPQQIVAVLQQPELRAALGAALAPLLTQQAGDAGQPTPHAEAAAPAAQAGGSRSRGAQGVASALAAPPTAEAATIAVLQRQVAALHETNVPLQQEPVAAGGEPAGAPAELRRAVVATPRAPTPAIAPAAARSQPRPNPAPGGRVMAGRQRGQKRQVSPSPACYWEGTGDARRHLKQQVGCRSTGPSVIAAPECFSLHPLAATRPYRAKEDVKAEERVVTLNSFTIREYVQQLEAQNSQPPSQGHRDAQQGPSQEAPQRLFGCGGPPFGDRQPCPRAGGGGAWTAKGWPLVGPAHCGKPCRRSCPMLLWSIPGASTGAPLRVWGKSRRAGTWRNGAS